MRTRWLLLALLVMPATVLAQSVLYTSPVAVVSPAPSGFCLSTQGYPILVNALTGDAYTCKNQSWALIGNSGSTSYPGVTSSGTGGLTGNPGSGTTWTIAPNGDYTLTGAPSGSALAADGSGYVVVGHAVTSINTTTHAVTTLGADAIGSVTPEIDIRTHGAVINNSTPIDTAFQDALNACPNIGTGIGGNSCQILLPCGGAGCFLQNGSSITYPAGHEVIIQALLQGNLNCGSTCILPAAIQWLGQGGGYPSAFFAMNGSNATIAGPNTYGTMNTAVTTVGSSVSITPTITSGPVPVSGALWAMTVAGTMTCTASASVVGGGSTTFTISNCSNSSGTSGQELRISAGSTVTITGCSDSTVDATGMPVQYADFPAGTLQVATSSGSTRTATGCTVVGASMDDFETVYVHGWNGTSGTATFAHVHAASDQWNEVGVATQTNTFSNHDYRNITFMGAGAAMWVEAGYYFDFQNDSFITTRVGQNMPSIPMEWAGAAFGNMNNVELDSIGLGECTYNCGTVGYPYTMRLTQIYEGLDAGGTAGPTRISTGIFNDGGIEEDGNLIESYSNSIPAMEDILVEEPTGAFISIDNRLYYNPASYEPIQLHNIFMQDNFHNAISYYVMMTDNNPQQQPIEIQSDGGSASANSPYGPPVSVNNYFVGSVNGQNMNAAVLPYGHGAASGVLESQGTLETELRGEAAGFSPQIIPYTTLSVAPANCLGYPSGWNCAGTLTTGILDPLGGTSAVSFSNSSSGYASIGFYTPSYDYVGDTILYGGWVSPGASCTPYTDNFQIVIDSAGPVWSGTNTGNFGGEYACDWWHPQVGEAVATTAGSSRVEFRILVNNNTIELYQPFWIYIPASANIPRAEIERWRQQLLHGAVPQNYTGGTGHAVTLAPIDALGFNILNPATGAVSTKGLDRCSGGTMDGAIVAASSTEATACTTAGGSLVATGYTTQ